MGDPHHHCCGTGFDGRNVALEEDIKIQLFRGGVCLDVSRKCVTIRAGRGAHSDLRPTIYL